MPPPSDSCALENPVWELLSAYERTRLPKAVIDSVLSYMEPVSEGFGQHEGVEPGSPDRFPTSGLYDLRSVLSIVEEHYRGHVILDWQPLEVAPGTYNPLWGEVNDRRQFRASVRMPTHVKQERRDFRRSSAGEQITQPATMTLAIPILWRAGYLPRAGDQVRFRNTQYEVLAAHVDPGHYWQNTGFPLYLTCEMGIAMKDSRFLDCSRNPSQEPGSPSSTEPLGEPSSTGEPL